MLSAVVEGLWCAARDRPSDGSQQKDASSEGDSGAGSIGGFGLPTVLSVESPWRDWLQEQESASPQSGASAAAAGAAEIPRASKIAQNISSVCMLQSGVGFEEAVGVSMGGDAPGVGARRSGSKTKHSPGPVGEGTEDSYFEQAALQPTGTATGAIRTIHLFLHHALRCAKDNAHTPFRYFRSPKIPWLSNIDLKHPCSFT